MSDLEEAGVRRLPKNLSGDGGLNSLDGLMPEVHAELRRLARAYLARQRRGHTLQPTALINEAYVKLAGAREMQWSRAHFIAAAAQAMRSILVDHCRKSRYVKHGGGAVRVTFDEALNISSSRDAALIDLDETLKKLEVQDPRKSRIAELRFFGGLSVEETADVLSVSVATVMRDWRITKAWLYRELT